MNLKDIMAISGYSGLFRFVSQGRGGVIVEGLIDKKRMTASGSSRVSALDDIAIFTDDKEVPLKVILRSIFQKENGGPTIDPKSTPDQLKKYFEKILPEYNREKVYPSDIKKVLTWYGLLLSNNIIDLEEDAETAETAEVPAETLGEIKE